MIESEFYEPYKHLNKMAELAKALKRDFEMNKLVPQKTWDEQMDEMHFQSIKEQVIQWGKDKGILVPENAHKQALKMVSEVGELCDELIKNDQQAFKNEFGDVLVTLIILAEQTDVSLTECLQLAYDKIKDRKGKTESGIFIKE